MEKKETKGIKCIRSRVANITEFLGEELTMDEFKEMLLRNIFDVEDLNEIPRYELTEEDWENVYQLAEERYRTWDWNYGKSPSFNIKESYKFDSGLLDLRLNVKKGIIENCTIYGDFFGDRKSTCLNSSHV